MKNNLGENANVFRAMKQEPDGLPRIGRSGRELGVRIEGPHIDIATDETGMVEPKTGGMSVAAGSAKNLPKPRRPRSLGGEGRDPVFKIAAADGPRSLCIRVDNHPHALIEPGERVPLSVFETDLESTRTFWREGHD
jgi:hypothetical protein